jgi:hypothetical protein
MTTKTPLTDAERLASLEAQLRAERQRVAQREQMLATLNRRLVVLEQGTGAVDPATGLPAGPEALRERVRRLEAELAEARQELQRIRQTKLFKWSAPLRRVYAALGRR